MALDFPWQLRFTGAVFHPANVSRTGGRSLTGSMQVVRSNAGLWRATISVPVYEEDRTLAYRAFVASLGGMAGEVLVPAPSKWRPYGHDGGMLPMDEAATLQGRTLWDHSGFGQTEAAYITVGSAVSMGGTRMDINHPGVEGLRPGHYFGIGEHLYMVTASAKTEVETRMFPDLELTFGGEALEFGDEVLTFGADEDVTIEVIGTNRSVIDFWPRLREPVAANTALVLGRPVCRMRLVSDDSGVLDQGVGFLGNPTLEFEEAV